MAKTKNKLYPANLSKNAMKKKKYRETKKAKKELESSAPNAKSIEENSETSVMNEDSQLDLELTDDPEKNKKIKKVKSVSAHLKCEMTSIKLINLIFYRN